MEKKEKIKNGKRSGLIGAAAFLLWPAFFVLAASNPNYGTTTFFSGTEEKPVLEKPILGADNGSGNDHGSKGDKNGGNGDGGIVDPGDVFNQIGNAIGTVVDNSVNSLNDAKKSLFDLQSGDFGSGGSANDSTFNKPDEFFIAGPKGESPEHMASLKDNGSDSQASVFNFQDTSLKVAPKKSKFLFMNTVIDVDMTSQYVILALIFLISVGSAIGYYQMNKGGAGKGRKRL